MIKIEIGNPDKKRSSFSKKFLVMYMINIQIIALVTLYLCYLCIKLNYTGGLAPLVALIGFAEVSFGIVCKEFLNKSKAENTSGGIVYESVVGKASKIDIDDI